MTAWGENTYGQLGDGSLLDRPRPVQLTGIEKVISVAAGGWHSLALTSDGRVWAWGRDGFGQLGQGQVACSGADLSESPVPVLDPSGSGDLTGVVAIAAGSHHSLAVMVDGTVLAWGDNSAGQLGLDPASTRLQRMPTPLVLPVSVTAVAAGQGFSAALAASGDVWTWGDNAAGQLGRTVTPPAVAYDPGVVAVGQPVKAIAAGAGGNHLLALAAGGTVHAWGANGYGQLGETTRVDSSTPVSVGMPVSLPAVRIRAIAAGSKHSLALSSDGSVYAWGWNGLGQLGVATTDLDQLSAKQLPMSCATMGCTGRFSFGEVVPVRLTEISGVRAIAAGGLHSMALRDDGTVWTWGYNVSGHLGLGTSGVGTEENTPRQVPGLANVIAISAGWYHSLALEGSGVLWAWGYNSVGELGIGRKFDR